MRLEKIVLNGFKSFADKTGFTFDSAVTAIVGPNGCGKSNVVDAVKWVLGEQSVKSLRSGQMADVIFSGSSNRKALGAADVTLFISNTKGRLPIEADEVEISRKIYKSGESEYRINNKLCRLKDIRELFMDTGVGVKAYSIIEQGQIELLLNASKTDRRVIFEEAAGISKYKAHKKEALRKLERTEQNLLRLADILGEVQKQLRSVKLQAGKARNYLKYTERLKELRVNYSLAEYHKINTESQLRRSEIEQVEQQFAAVAAELAKEDALMSALGNEIIETEHELNRTDNSLVSVQSKIEQNMQRIDFLRTRITELEQRRSSANQRIEKLQEEGQVFYADLCQYKEELVSCDKMLEAKSLAAEQLQETLQEIRKESASIEADLEDEKSGIIDIVRRTAQLHNEVQSISVHRSTLSSQKERLTGRAGSTKAELEKLLTEKAQHKARQSDIDKVMSELTESLESKRKEIEQISSHIAADNKRLANSKEARSALSSELAVLKDMETRCEGVNTAVKSILQNRSVENNKFDYIEGMLAETITADVEYSSAVEASLEGKTDALVVKNTDRLLADMETIGKLDGRVNFVCMDKTGPFVDRKDLSKFPHVRGRVVEFVKTESEYAPLVWKLLGKTLIVDSIDKAVELAGKTDNEYEFVTLKGELLSADGTIKVGRFGKTAGLISRKSRLRQLQKAINNISDEVNVIDEQIERNNQTKTHLTRLCQDLRTAIYETNTEKMHISSKLAVYEQNINRLGQEQPLIAGEIDMLEEQIAESVQKEYNSKQKLLEMEAVNSERMARIKELETKYAEQKELQQLQMSEMTDLKVLLGQVAEQSKAMKQTIALLEGRIQANQTALQSSEEEIQNCGEQMQRAQSDILGCEASGEEMVVEKEKSRQSSIQLHKKTEKLLEEQKEKEQLLRQRRNEKSEIDRKINQLRIEMSQFEVREQSLIERVQDDLHIDLQQAYEDYEDTQVDWEKVKDEIDELRGKIERLGSVNVEAIESQENLEKRNEFLSAHVEDLDKSKAQLQQLINRLNKKSREKFRETFEEVRGHFQQIFRKLFGGGKADIVLEDAEDILEAPIEIIAQPPGKETRSISLLSGGEKALTAIALLFAVFKTKPSPFCFLDEVDAALDEANNERFNILLAEFQKDSQFIIITHSKRTMSIVDVLYGITMQTRGVSRKISVRFDQYEEQAESAAQTESAAVA